MGLSHPIRLMVGTSIVNILCRTFMDNFLNNIDSKLGHILRYNK